MLKTTIRYFSNFYSRYDFFYCHRYVGWFV